MKADACDIRKGLRESVAGKWAGDEDLGDKTLEELFAEYRKRCAFVKNLEIRNRDKMKEDCEILLSSVNKDGEFLASGEKEARIAYEKALERTNLSENSMMELSWQHIGFVELQKTLEKVQANQFVRKFHDGAIVATHWLCRTAENTGESSGDVVIHLNIHNPW